MEQRIGLSGFLESCLERCHQGVGQVADEADRVREQGLATPLEPPFARAGVERGEKPALDQNPRVGQGVHEGALAGVGVANQGDGRDIRPAGHLTFLTRLDLGELPLSSWIL